MKKSTGSLAFDYANAEIAKKLGTAEGSMTTNPAPTTEEREQFEMKNNLDETISGLPVSAILEITKKLLGIATRRLASGQDVTQENIAIVNRARKAVKASR